MRKEEKTGIIVCKNCTKRFDFCRERRYNFFSPFRCSYCGEKHSLSDEMKKPPQSSDKYVNDKSLYVIEDVDGVFKIGISCEPKTRLKSLQQASSTKLDLIYTHHCPEPAVQHERTFHERFSEHRLQGEWFDLSKKKLAEAVGEEFGEDL